MEDIKVIEWLNYCDENNIKPWLWDFKNYSLSPFPNDSITACLKYKELPENEGIDCDKAALFLYKVLGWQDNPKAITRGETINSYTTTFTQAVTKDPNYKKICKKIGVNLDEYLNKQYPILYHNKNYQNFDIIQKNIKRFELFAKLTHTIGNFTVLPHWMNTGRYNFSKDYWDITMLSLQEWFAILPKGTWNSFVDTFYLQPYVNDKYEVELFWDNHTDSKPFPKLQHYPIFLKKVNERIEERGKFIIKQVCDKLNQKDYHFYKEIENMDKIKFSNEF